MRRIVVPIAAETRECGGCLGEGWANDPDHENGGVPWCAFFNRELHYGVDVAGNDPGCEHETQRLPECLAAEVKS